MPQRCAELPHSGQTGAKAGTGSRSGRIAAPSRNRDPDPFDPAWPKSRPGRLSPRPESRPWMTRGLSRRNQ